MQIESPQSAVPSPTLNGGFPPGKLFGVRRESDVERPIVVGFPTVSRLNKHRMLAELGTRLSRSVNAR